MPPFFNSVVLLPLVIVLSTPHLSSCQNVSKTTNKTLINIGVLLDFPDDSRLPGYHFAVDLAKSVIENSTELKHLTDQYKLNNAIGYDYGDPSDAITNVYKIANERKPKPLVFVGPIRPKTVDYAAKTVGKYRTPFVTTASVFQEDTHTSYVFSAASGVTQEVMARLAFLKKFKWKRAAILYSLRNSYHTMYVERMLDVFKDEKYKVRLTGLIGIETRKDLLENGIEVLHNKLERLKQNDTKIFIADMDPYEALFLFCEVYKLKLFGEDIVWIISSNAKEIDQWFKLYKASRSNHNVTCSKEDIYKAANGAFVFDGQIFREDSHRTTSGLTADEYLDKLDQMANGTKDREKLKQTSLVFDALWAVATALNNSIDPLQKLNRSLSIDNLSLREIRTVEKRIEIELARVDFQGIAGPYSYSISSSNYARDGTVRVLQHRGKYRVKVGDDDAKNGNLTFLNGSKSLWASGAPPEDHSTIEDNVLSISKSLFIAMSTLAALGILLGFLFLTFNLVYGKYKFIKLSAPLFNNIIACGCILSLISVFPFGMHNPQPDPQTSYPLICKARAWTLTIGFSLAFGAMFVKTWRIYKICTNKKLRMKLGPLSNWYLLSLVGGIVLGDLIILITWELVDPMKHKTVVVEEKRKHPNARFKYFNDVVNVCHANQMVVWLTIIYVYKGILILYGLFLAYETRNVIYAHLNDSRVIGICVYNVVVLSIVGAFLSLLLEVKNYKEMYLVLSVCIIFPAVATICLMMFPKIAYRCKTNNLDDTETIANGLQTVRDLSTYNGTTAGPEIHVTTHVPKDNTRQPSDSMNANFSYQKEVEVGSQEPSTS